MNKYSYLVASGPSWSNCDRIGVVSDPEQSRAVQSYALRCTPGYMDSVLVLESVFTDIWRSPAGRVYLVDSQGGSIWTGEPNSMESLQQTTLDFLPYKVFGLDDDNVYVLGGWKNEMRMCRWDGKQWNEMPAPERRMWGLHGCAPDCIVTVGDGIASRWDGHQWHAMDTQGAAMLASVWVESPDEMYACGDGRVLMQGSVYGWTPVLRHDATLASVAKWHGEVWVGAYGDLGLCKLRANELVSIKPNLWCTTIDARDELVLCCSNMVASTSDGENFFAGLIDNFKTLALEGTPPSWDW